MANFFLNESDDDSFTLASGQHHLNSGPITLNQQTQVQAFLGGQFSGVSFFALNASNAQAFANGQSASGFPLNSNGQYGLFNVTLPAGVAAPLIADGTVAVSVIGP